MNVTNGGVVDGEAATMELKEAIMRAKEGTIIVALDRQELCDDWRPIVLKCICAKDRRWQLMNEYGMVLNEPPDCPEAGSGGLRRARRERAPLRALRVVEGGCDRTGRVEQPGARAPNGGASIGRRRWHHL